MAEPEPTTAPGPVYRTSPCEACNAPIVWCLDRNATKVAVDAEPATPPAGQPGVLLTNRGVAAPLAEVVRNPAKLFGRRVYRRHLDTCPFKSHYQQRARRRNNL